MITEAIRVTDRWRRILQAKLRKAEAARDLVAIATLRAALTAPITEAELRQLYGDR